MISATPGDMVVMLSGLPDLGRPDLSLTPDEAETLASEIRAAASKAKRHCWAESPAMPDGTRLRCHQDRGHKDRHEGQWGEDGRLSGYLHWPNDAAAVRVEG